MSLDALDEEEGSEEAATLYNRPGEVPSVRPAAIVDDGTERSEGDDTTVRPLPRPPGIGDVVAEKYRLVSALGRGGMGRIFAADHLLLGTKVALKFMHPHLARDRQQVARFAREARAAATLKSEHAARMMDVDQLPGGELYIVMEYLEGTSLEALAVDGHGLPVADAVTYITQACDALAEAHSRSIIHRDVKPANLFLTKGKSGEPIIKVLDFGLAKSLLTGGDGGADTATIAGQTMGTPYYMSPEQITGRGPIDGRSDVWAIGVTLYELLTGRLAFGGTSAPIVFDLILQGRPTPLRTLRPDVPEALAAIVDRCLALDLNARFQTVRELVKALETSLVAAPEPPPFVAAPLRTERFVFSSAPPNPLPVGIGEPSVRSHVVTVPPSGSSLAPPDLEATGPSIGQTVLAALAGPVLIAIAAAVVYFVMQREPADTASASSEPRVPKHAEILAPKSDGAPRNKVPAPPTEKPDHPPKK